MNLRLVKRIAASTVAVTGLLLLPGASESGGQATGMADSNLATATAAAATPVSARPGSQSPPQIKPASVELPPALADVVRLCESGIKDDVVIAYIDTSSQAYNPTTDQIVYMRDVGVSPVVIQALVEHRGKENEQIAEAPVVQTPPSNQNTETQTESASAATTNIHVFYDSLSPYGTWVDLPSYGWCWQPTVAVVNPGWQPYCDNGYWLWSDYGWYWNSYYSWGWGPFHYGRWFRHPGWGWCWRPDNMWGPAWVCWRSSPLYCGWSPLPPGACFNAGLGWTFNDLPVGINFGFGLPSSCFTFVPNRHFCDRRPYSHFLSRHDADAAFQHSTVTDRFGTGDHHGFINRGIDRSRIEAATGSRVREVAVRELPHHAGAFLRPDRLDRSGNSPVIYRPDSRISVSRNPALDNLSHRHEVAGAQNRHSTFNPATVRTASSEGSHFSARPYEHRGTLNLAHHPSATTPRNAEHRTPTIPSRSSGYNRPPATAQSSGWSVLSSTRRHYEFHAPSAFSTRGWNGSGTAWNRPATPSYEFHPSVTRHNMPSFQFSRPSFTSQPHSFAPSFSHSFSRQSSPSFRSSFHSAPSFHGSAAWGGSRGYGFRHR